MKQFNIRKKSESDNMVFGTRAVIEAINAGKEIEKVLVQKGLNNELSRELLALVREFSLPLQYVPVEKLNGITRKNHQGTICYLSSIQYASLENIVDKAFAEGREPLLIMLDGVTDVRNFGGLARTMEAAGVNGIIVPKKGGAMIGSDAIKTSAGALHHIPVCRVDNLLKTAEYLQQWGVRLIACTEKTNEIMYQADLRGPICVVMGSEEDGISNDLIRRADMLLKIPMNGKIASLNVSVSAALMVYEVLRQRNFSE